MGNNEEKEVSLGRIFRVMFNRKIPLIAITLGTMILGCLGIKFIYNSGKAVYKAEYKYNVESFNGNGKYIDGSAYFFNSLATQSVLNEVKSKSVEYNNLDIEKMIENNAVEIQLNKTYDSNKEPLDTYYTLSIKQSYFKSDKQAKDFITDLINYPINHNKKLQEVINYKGNLQNFDQVEFYDYQISYLENQLNYILSKYDGLIGTYGDVNTSAQYGEKKLSTLKNELNMYFVNYSINDLRIEVNQYGYVKDYNNHVYILQLRRSNYLKTIEYNKKTIEQLNKQITDLLNGSSTSQSFDLSSYNAKIAELLAENVDLQKKVDDLDIQIEKGNNNSDQYHEFQKKLSSYRQKLELETDMYKSVEKEVMEDNSKVFFKNSNIIEGEGEISTLIGLVGTCVAGIIIGAVVNLILDRKYLYEDFPAKVEKKKEEVVEETAK